MSLQGFHFILPLSALDIISSETVRLNAVQWLFRLDSNFTVLKKKSEEVSHCEDEIEAVCEELLYLASATVERVKREFAKVKGSFNLEVDRAIAETRTRALDAGDQASTNPLAQLLWYWEPIEISGYQMFTFQAKCAQECVDSAVDVTFNVALPGLEDLGFEHSKKTKQAEYDAIKKELEDAKFGLKTEIERSTNLENAAFQAMEWADEAIAKAVNEKNDALQAMELAEEAKVKAVNEKNAALQAMELADEGMAKAENEKNSALQSIESSELATAMVATEVAESITEQRRQATIAHLNTQH